MTQRPDIDALTRTEWRELGFYYDYTAKTRTWLIAASRAGLVRFAELIAECASSPSFQTVSEHEHFGPYMYLEVMSWTEPRIDEHAIAGRPTDLARLSSLVHEHALRLPEGSAIEIASEYAPGTTHRLELRCYPADCDPASLDPRLAAGNDCQ